MADRAAGVERAPVGRPAARSASAWERVLVATLGGIVGGWLAVDGVRALVTGDYATPAGGPYAGQLGPWAALVESVGLDPRSILVMGLHVVTGGLWLAAGALAAARRSGRPLLAVASVASLWYLPFGTLAGLLGLGLVWRGRG